MTKNRTRKIGKTYNNHDKKIKQSTYQKLLEALTGEISTEEGEKRKRIFSYNNKDRNNAKIK